jgi:hypothetical protein
MQGVFDMNLKTGIVILAVLGLCFFTGVGNGLLRTNDSSTGDPPPWSRDLDSLFRVKATVDDVLSGSPSGSCLINRATRRLTVPPGQLCTYTLSTALLPRRISLQLVAGFQANVQVNQPIKEDGTRDITDNENLGGGTSRPFRISSRQSKNDRIELRITCLDVTTGCVLQILE